MGGDQAEGAVIVAGIGCRRMCAGEEIAGLVRQAEDLAGARADVIAAPGFKSTEPGLAEAAIVLALPLLWVDDAALQAAQPGCVTRSAVAERHTGFASIAEAAALAAAGPGATLRLPRIATTAATCALAESSHS